jgi:putative flippase GtrA
VHTGASPTMHAMINGSRLSTGGRTRGAPVAWHAHRATVARLVRYAAVSLVATATSLVTLGVLVGMFGWPAAWSNVVATAVGTVPSFELNRRWVWSSRTSRSLLRQIVPFCALSFAGLVLSTLAVGVVSAHTMGWSRFDHTVAVETANLSAYGALWIIQYQLLDRVLFSRPRNPVPEAVVGSSTLTADRQTATSPVGIEDSMLGAGAPRPAVLTRERNDSMDGTNESTRAGGTEGSDPESAPPPQPALLSRGAAGRGSGRPSPSPFRRHPVRWSLAAGGLTAVLALGGYGVTQAASSSTPSSSAAVTGGATMGGPPGSPAGSGGSAATGSGATPRRGSGGTVGIVTGISANTITLNSHGNSTIKVTVTSSTNYKDGSKISTSAALKKGDLAIVTGSTSSDGTVTATTVDFRTSPGGKFGQQPSSPEA